MFISNLIFVALSLGGGAHAFAIPADQSANVDWRDLQWDISKFTNGEPIESGRGEEISIPQLAGLNVTHHDGSMTYEIPRGGIDIPEELYIKLGGKKSRALALEKRCDGNRCDCGTHRTYQLTDVDWSKFLGDTKIMSSPVCGPGSITSSYTATYSYSITGTLTAGFGPFSTFKGVDLSVGFGYTWGNAVATGYSSTCDAAHPCIATFRPYLGKVTGRAHYTDLSDDGNKLCGGGTAGNIEIQLPVTRDCTDTNCGADGVWDHCYYLGDTAKAMCPNLGPTPKPECAANLYPGGS